MAPWEEVLGGNKPPAQGPGPGGMPQQQMNGGDDNGGGPVGNVVVVPPNVTMQRSMQQQQQQMVAHHLLQQGNKNQMVQMGMGGNKSPNLQAGNATQSSSLANSLGGGPMGNSMVMSIASNGNQQQPMSSMQGKWRSSNLVLSLCVILRSSLL